jgi:hypothetical protein
MSKIAKTPNVQNSGRYTVAMNLADEKIEIFVNRDDEYIMRLGFKIISKANSYEEAERKTKAFLHRNAQYCVISFTQKGKIIYTPYRVEGIITNAPMGTVAIFSKKRDAMHFIKLLTARAERILKIA